MAPPPASELAADARAATAVSASAADSADVRRLRLCSLGEPPGLGFGLQSLSLLRDGPFFDLGGEGLASASMADADGRPDDIVAALRGGAGPGGGRCGAWSGCGAARRGEGVRSAPLWGVDAAGLGGESPGIGDNARRVSVMCPQPARPLVLPHNVSGT